MAWPLSERTFGTRLGEARQEYADVAHAIAAFEPVRMLYDPDNCSGVEALEGVPNITLAECPLNDSWVRDTGPTFVLDTDGNLAGVDWAFDGWGADWPTDKDAGIASQITALSGAKRVQLQMIFEGGALNIDDRATIVTTRQCFEYRTRIGGPSKAEFE
ncbi:agmatine deiminase family protein [Rhodobacteraceae bacterium B1Z28]|uniref:Agmatine deiminase family protein n=1 Tax=Ruegeria haliotis TaxID=2747601 RepID=A0ABX2PVM4_9RHOB|nr:agmatine deiminase family protein [Ruegeria haliotis]